MPGVPEFRRLRLEVHNKFINSMSYRVGSYLEELSKKKRGTTRYQTFNIMSVNEAGEIDDSVVMSNGCSS